MAARSKAAHLLGLRVQIPPRACMLVSCVLSEVSASGWSVVHTSPNESGVFECDREASTLRGCRTIGGKNENYAGHSNNI